MSESLAFSAEDSARISPRCSWSTTTDSGTDRRPVTDPFGHCQQRLAHRSGHRHVGRAVLGVGLRLIERDDDLVALPRDVITLAGSLPCECLVYLSLDVVHLLVEEAVEERTRNLVDQGHVELEQCRHCLRTS